MISEYCPLGCLCVFSWEGYTGLWTATLPCLRASVTGQYFERATNVEREYVARRQIDDAVRTPCSSKRVIVTSGNRLRGRRDAELCFGFSVFRDINYARVHSARAHCCKANRLRDLGVLIYHDQRVWVTCEIDMLAWITLASEGSGGQVDRLEQVYRRALKLCDTICVRTNYSIPRPFRMRFDVCIS